MANGPADSPLSPTPDSGHGLVGLRERVNTLRGRLRYGLFLDRDKRLNRLADT